MAQYGFTADVVDETPEIPVGQGIRGTIGFQDTSTDAAHAYHPAGNDRELDFDVQRGTLTHTYYVRGRPDVAVLNPYLAAFRVGSAHPWNTSDNAEWCRHFYVVRVRIEHASQGSEEGDDTPAQAWSKVTVIYQQRPCPNAFEERWRIGLHPYMEWYTRPSLPEATPENPNPTAEAPELLSQTPGGLQVLRPVPIVTRYYPRLVFPDRSAILALESHLGKLNSSPFMGHEEGFWMFDGLQMDHLHGEPGDSDDVSDVVYAATLVFRGDPYRHHEMWFAKRGPFTHLPLDPSQVPNATYEGMHDRKQVYQFAPAGSNWEDLIPVDPDACKSDVVSLPGETY